MSAISKERLRALVASYSGSQRDVALHLLDEHELAGHQESQPVAKSEMISTYRVRQQISMLPGKGVGANWDEALEALESSSDEKVVLHS